jgi:hypothetical protein
MWTEESKDVQYVLLQQALPESYFFKYGDKLFKMMVLHVF